MSKKKPKKNKGNSFYSELKQHKKVGKTLTPPMMQIPNVVFRSWSDRCIPNILWACLLIASIPREKCLKLFRSVVINTRERVPEYEHTFITHNYLALYDEAQFDLMFFDVLADEEAKAVLSALLLVDTLPDKTLWEKKLDAPTPDTHWPILAKSVGLCFAHQSQEATDIRWMKVMHFLCMGKMHFPSSMSEMLEEMRLYPNKGDMRKVRPNIRASEMSVRSWEFGEESITDTDEINLPPAHDELFWQEMLHKTECHFFENAPSVPDTSKVQKELMILYEELSEHFFTTLENTNINPKHDAAFGIVLYSISLVMSSTLSINSTSTAGRFALRTLTELYINLHFLVKKDNPTIWQKYRSYGSGQAKLAFLKNTAKEDLPEYINIERLEQLASEDLWMEFQNISLGSWLGSNLREIAKEAGVQHIYDKYYDWLSGYTHGHWGAVRDTVFDICINPLHRFHRVPLKPNFVMPSVLPDCCKLINMMLDDINQLYPQFKLRLRSYKEI